MRAVVVQYAIGRFKTWTGLDIWFPEGSYLCLERQYWFPEGNIWFFEGSSSSQIRMRGRQMMYVDQFEVFRFTNHDKSLHHGRPTKSNISVQRT